MASHRLAPPYQSRYNLMRCSERIARRKNKCQSILIVVKLVVSNSNATNHSPTPHSKPAPNAARRRSKRLSHPPRLSLKVRGFTLPITSHLREILPTRRKPTRKKRKAHRRKVLPLKTNLLRAKKAKARNKNHIKKSETMVSLFFIYKITSYALFRYYFFAFSSRPITSITATEAICTMASTSSPVCRT